MNWLTRSGVRAAVLSAGVAGVTALVVAGGPALAQSSAPAVAATPVIVSGVGHSTVFLNTATFTTLGRLHLGAGSWTVFAKAEVTVNQSLALHCRATAGTDSDLIDPQIDAATMGTQEVTVNVTHVFTRAGNVTFACNSSGVSVAASQIKMTAIKAGTLTRVNL